eukprot:3105369-Prymnesium_polylepis.3
MALASAGTGGGDVCGAHVHVRFRARSTVGTGSGRTHQGRTIPTARSRVLVALQGRGRILLITFCMNEPGLYYNGMPYHSQKNQV